MPVNALQEHVPRGNALRDTVDPRLLEIMRRERLRAAEHAAGTPREVPSFSGQLRDLLDIAAMAPTGAGDVADIASLGLSLRDPEFREALTERPRFKTRGELLADAVSHVTPESSLLERLSGVPRLLQAMNPLLQTGLNEEQMRLAGVLPVIPGTARGVARSRHAADDTSRSTETLEALREQGFDTSTPLYHATTSRFDRFRPGSYFAVDRRYSEDWIAGVPEEYDPHIRTVYIRGRQYEADDRETDLIFSDPSLLDEDEAFERASLLRDLKEQGYSSIYSPINGGEVYVFDPDDIIDAPDVAAPKTTRAADETPPLRTTETK